MSTYRPLKLGMYKKYSWGGGRVLRIVQMRNERRFDILNNNESKLIYTGITELIQHSFLLTCHFLHFYFTVYNEFSNKEWKTKKHIPEVLHHSINVLSNKITCKYYVKKFILKKQRIYKLLILLFWSYRRKIN